MKIIQRMLNEMKKKESEDSEGSYMALGTTFGLLYGVIYGDIFF